MTETLPKPEGFMDTLEQNYWWKDRDQGWVCIDDVDPSHLIGIHQYLAGAEHMATSMGQYVEWLHDELDHEYYADMARGEIGPTDMTGFPRVNRWRVGLMIAGIFATD